MTWLDALKVGVAQCFALIPGTSRSGATIIGGMLFGLSRRAATEFSFFLAVPTLLARAPTICGKTARSSRRGICRCSRSASPPLRLRFHRHPLADSLRRDPRLPAVRVVPDRVRRRGAVNGLLRMGELARLKTGTDHVFRSYAWENVVCPCFSPAPKADLLCASRDAAAMLLVVLVALEAFEHVVGLAPSSLHRGFGGAVRACPGAADEHYRFVFFVTAASSPMNSGLGRLPG